MSFKKIQNYTKLLPRQSLLVNIAMELSQMSIISKTFITFSISSNSFTAAAMYLTIYADLAHTLSLKVVIVKMPF